MASVTGRDLGAEGLHRRGPRSALRRLPRELATARILDDGRAADRARQRAKDSVEPAPLDDETLELLVDPRPPLQYRVLLVHQAREGTLRDRDERHLVGDLEHRNPQLRRLVDERLGHLLVLEPRTDADPRDAVVREAFAELALPRGGVQLDARGEQQLTARQPRGGVLDLGDVHPPNGALRSVGPGDQLEAAI